MARAARRGYANPMRAGLITIFVLIFVTIYGFTKDNPFHRAYHIGVVVQDAAGIKPGSIVRIAGVDVGQVTNVERYNGAEAAQVNMDINSTGLPVHVDARVRVRPRLFLEGNFVLEISPGTPGAPVIKDGGVIPITHTTRAVQLDQVLSTLQGPERKDLQVVLQQLGRAFAEKDPLDKNPLTKGQSAGESLNDTIAVAASAGTDIEKLARALQGQNKGDLAGVIRSLAKTTAPIAANADELAQLIEGLDQTVSVFADNTTAVSASISELPVTVAAANKNLPIVNDALGPLGNVADHVTPALDNVPALVKASGPFLTQSKAFLSPEEGGALADSLEPITSGLAKASPSLASTLNDLSRISVCTSQVLAPTANQVIQDGQYTTGISSYDEFLRGMVGLASTGQNFDANGLYGRAAAAQGANVVSGQVQRMTAKGTKASYIGTANSTPLSTRPAKPGNTLMSPTGSPWKFDVACDKKQLQNLSAVPTGKADGQDPVTP